MSVNPMSLGVIKTPKEMNADIVTAEGQGLGNYLNFGGPYLGIIATNTKYIRQLPGRIAGRTVDSSGRDAYVLTLQAREQHIKRQKATSNICSNQNLIALRTLVYLSLLGRDGLREIAATNHNNASLLKEKLQNVNGVQVINATFFNEFTVELQKPAKPLFENLLEKNISFGFPLQIVYPEIDSMENKLLLAVTEKRSTEEMESAVAALEEALL
jgi:glycine dehydrogenase subunit 1